MKEYAKPNVVRLAMSSVEDLADFLKFDSEINELGNESHIFSFLFTSGLSYEA